MFKKLLVTLSLMSPMIGQCAETAVYYNRDLAGTMKSVEFQYLPVDYFFVNVGFCKYSSTYNSNISKVLIGMRWDVLPKTHLEIGYGMYKENFRRVKEGTEAASGLNPAAASIGLHYDLTPSLAAKIGFNYYGTHPDIPEHKFIGTRYVNTIGVGFTF